MPNHERVSRSERRVNRKKEKSIKNLQANGRLLTQLGMVKKLPRNVEIPDLRKIPRHTKIDTYKESLFTWSHLNADQAGEWSWGEKREWTDDEFSDDISKHLNSLIGNTWLEVENQTFNGARQKRKKIHTYQRVDTIVPEAINRWMELEPFNEYETSFKCHIRGRVRVWGIREGSTYYLVWFERYHLICPAR